MQIDRTLLLRRWQGLKTERSSWIDQWQSISRYLLPRSGRFFVQDRNRGESRYNEIYDNTGIRALRVLSAGMMSYMTSPSKPWFRLSTADTELMQYAPVKTWLHDVTELMHTIFQRSNTYRALHAMYDELAAFGTAASIVVPDFKNVIQLFPLTIGEYAIATNWKGEVNTLYREFQKSIHEVVAEFGIENCSATIQSMYRNGNLDAWVTIVHCIEPREDRDTAKQDAKNMPWRSIYFELQGAQTAFLRESGFKRFPALCPRWSVSGGDIYGTSPGIESLGDIKQLQHEQVRKGQVIDYKTKPPLQVPTSLKNRDVNILPGGITPVDMTGPNSGVKTLFDVNLDLNSLLGDIQDVRGRIQSTFYADLFLMIANQNDGRMTATEVAERHEEKLLMLGPVTERLQNELLDPLIELTFDHIMTAGIAPPPPRELEGHELNVELVSMLAQAQRAVGTNSIDRFVNSLGAVAQFKPEALDRLNVDKWADIYSDSLGVDPHLLVPQDSVDAMRQQRAQAAQAAQQSALINQNADTAQKLSAAKTDESNVLSDVTRAFSGYTS